MSKWFTSATPLCPISRSTKIKSAGKTFELDTTAPKKPTKQKQDIGPVRISGNMENEEISLLTKAASYLGARREKNEVFTESEVLLEGLFFQQVLIFEALNSSPELMDKAAKALEEVSALMSNK
jgi:hypothetical protein